MKRVMSGRKSRRFMGRLLAGMTAAAVFVSSFAVPGNEVRVYAKETKTGGAVSKEPEVRSVNLNIDGKIAGLENPTVPESTEAEWSNGTGTYIYYASIGRSRLLDADTTDFSRDGEHSLFAVSDGQVNRDIFCMDQEADNGQKCANDWKYSDMYLYLNGETGIESPYTYYPGHIAGKLFSRAQMAALINNYNDSHKDWEETSGEMGYAGLDGEKLFLLDAREIEHEGYGFSHTHEGSKSQFFRNGGAFLRSPSLADDMKIGIMRANASDNLKSDVTTWDVRDNAGVVYPAYNIRLSSVFYTAYREEDQFLSANLDPDESYRMTKEKGGSNAWTVAVFDGNDGFRARRIDDDGILQPGGGIHFTIDSMGQPGEDVEYDRISAMLVDESGTVIAYGKIYDLPGNGGIHMIKIPEGVEDGKYTVKIFAEDMLYEPEWHGYFYTPAGSVASNPVDIEIEVDKRPEPSLQFHTYTPSVIYSGNRLSVPGKNEMGIMGAGYEDVEFRWYKDSVSEENRLEEAPKDTGTYYLEASIPETETLRGASAVNGPTAITPKTVTPYIEGSISKIYDGSDSIDGAENTLSIRLEGIIEDENVSASGKIRYADSEIGTDKSIIAEDIEIIGEGKDNYILSSTTATADIGTIGKKEYPLNIPQSEIAVANTVKKVSESLVLPEGWEWQNEDGEKEIPAGKCVVATAEYTGDDKEIYETTSVAVTITREACTEETAVRFDGDGDYEPTCEKQGKGHTICSVCGDIVRDSVTVDAKGHDWDADFTIDKAADCKKTGSKSIHCKNCDSKKDVTEIEITAHSWNEGEVVQEATCWKEGEKVFSCNHCGETRTETLAKTEHIPGVSVKENSVDAGCTESGSYDEAVYCTSCSQEISRKKIEVAASGHNLSKVDEKAATATETGYREHWACSRCGGLFSDKDALNEITVFDVTIPKVDGQKTEGTGSNGENDNSNPSASKPDDNTENPAKPPLDGKDTPGSSQTGDDKKFPKDTAGDNTTSFPNPSDNGGAMPTPSPSQDNGDVDKDKTEADGTDTGKDKTDAENVNSQKSKPQTKAGEQFKDVDTNAVYAVLSVSSRTVAYVKPLDKKQKTVTIPAAVRINVVK